MKDRNLECVCGFKVSAMWGDGDHPRFYCARCGAEMKEQKDESAE